MKKKHRRPKSPRRPSPKVTPAKATAKSSSAKAKPPKRQPGRTKSPRLPQPADLAATLGTHLSKLPLEATARATRFCRRKAKKLTPALFVQAACVVVTLESVSYRCWAGLIGLLGRCTLTKQGLYERLTDGAARFLQATLQGLLQNLAKSNGMVLPAALSSFSRVLIQDSTTLAVSQALARFFPGARNQRGAKGGLLKIQACYDLLTDQFVHFSLSSFRRNDQAASADVLPLLRVGDLVIRDLGYFALEVMEQIGLAQAFFLSRWRVGVGLWEIDGRTPVHLLALLRRQGRLDREFCLGDKKVRARLVAVRLPAEVAAERRRLARANRDQRCPPSAERLALLDWAIYVTNVSAKVWSAREVAQTYGLRWRIEIIFKSWKSHFALADVPAGSKAQAESLIYAKLIFITVFQVWFAQCHGEDWAVDRPAMSLLKVAQAVRDYFLTLMVLHLGINALAAWQQLLSTHCRYERRKRRHFMQDGELCSYAMANLKGN